MNSQEEEQIFTRAGWVKDVIARGYVGPLSHLSPEDHELVSLVQGENRFFVGYDFLVNNMSSHQAEEDLKVFLRGVTRHD